jgi:hypothetical protein
LVGPKTSARVRNIGTERSGVWVAWGLRERRNAYVAAGARDLVFGWPY